MGHFQHIYCAVPYGLAYYNSHIHFYIQKLRAGGKYQEWVDANLFLLIKAKSKSGTYMIILSLQYGYFDFSSSFCISENLILGPFLAHLHLDPKRRNIHSLVKENHGIICTALIIRTLSPSFLAINLCKLMSF